MSTPLVTIDTGPRIERLDLADLLSKPPPRISWLWRDYIERGTLTVLHGMGGLGKSMLGLGLCRAVTLGGRFLDHDTEQGNVLYIDAENPRDEIARRLHRLDFTPASAERLSYLRAFEALLSRPDAAEWLIDEANAIDASLIMLDSQRALSSGDEKEQRDMRTLYDLLRHRVVEQTGASALVLHHDNKQGAYSGSTDIDASVDTRLHLHKARNADEDDRRVNLTHAKARSGSPQPKIGVDMVFDAGRVYITPKEPSGSTSGSTQPARDDMQERILTLLADGTAYARPDAARALHVDRTNRTLRRAWDELITNGILATSDNRTWRLA